MSVDVDREERVVAVIPATGWLAEYELPDGPEFEPVIAWGLQEVGSLVAMTADPGGYAHPAPDEGNFVRIVRIEDVRQGASR